MEAGRAPESVPQLQPLGPIDSLISLIYRGPLEPVPWKQFLDALRARTGSSFAAIIIRGNRRDARPLVVMEGEGESSIRTTRPAVADHVRLAPFDPLARMLEKPGDIFTLDEVMPWDVYKTTDFYKGIIQPYGIRHQLGMSFSDPRGWKCTVGLMNVEGMPAFGKQEKEFLLSFLPHLRSSLEMYSKIRREQCMKVALSETLDHLDIGTFILDSSGKVAVSNRVGWNLIHSGIGISVIDSKIMFARKADNDRLNALIQKACESGQSKQASPWIDALSVDCDDGHLLGVLVKAIPMTTQFDSDPNPRVTLYVSDSSQQRLAPEHLISKLFGLTATEAKLANLLSSGMSLFEIAEQLNVRENTVRTYSKRIFAKLGVNRQGELVRLILTSVATLA
jgi:DNA-binding CsgD family transcriptional regulator